MSLAQENEKWILAVSSKNSANSSLNASSVAKLNDPSTRLPRQYMLAKNNAADGQPVKSIVEVRSLPSDYSSFIVGRHIVKDGNLYVLNKVDPLFFVLSELLDPTSTAKIPWQPLDQCLSGLPEEIRECVAESQLAHICETLCTEQTDNVTYFKLSKTKALVWLRRKQERVFQCFLTQEERRRAQEKKRNDKIEKMGGGSRGGSVSSTFHIPDDSVSARPSSPESSTSDNVISSKEAERFKMESIQVVTSYLSGVWKQALLDSLEVSEDRAFGTTAKPSATTTTTSAPTTSGLVKVTTTDTSTKVPESVPTVTPKQPKKPVIKARSMGNKQLEKINKRGMTSLTSFFGPCKKKAKK